MMRLSQNFSFWEKLDIKLNQDEGVTILTGPNSYGKTTILTIIANLCAGKHVDRGLISGLTCFFSDGRQLYYGKTKQEFLYTLNSRSKEKTRKITEADIDNFIEAHKTTDYYNLCNGHDVLGFLVLYIDDKPSQREFAKILRASFYWRHFSQTDLYNPLKAWQTIHGFSMLKADAGV
jgi:ABC-type multidrug transport system ATPase subunit